MNKQDRYILHCLSVAVDECHKSFETYELHYGTQAIYNFFLYQLCDVYIEYSKFALNFGNETKQELTKSILFECLDTALRLLHPYMPFITEVKK